ncbi:acyl dehydratase [Jiella endophytica]|uniref:Acyl dehydratase n=1 Tax=Jiella endophytica TaxID=2558362 RepID=A0A4Y8RHX3_9HYPH|nr:acyl dehydratase [Jiella endophytica]TFF22016.1 acyl dehydratase [Jiella endophytica]
MTDPLPHAGQSITFRKTMTVAEQGFFTGISGNLGGLYVDRTRARSEGLADMAVFELAAGALFSTGLARLAGSSFRIASISFAFSRALPLGSSLAATVTVADASPEALGFDLTGTVDAETVVTGSARLVPVDPAG